MPPPSDVFPLDPSKPIIPVDVLLEGPKGRQFVRMAIDTGATYTIAPVGTLLAIGYNPSRPTQHIEFVAVGGVEYKPLVKVHAVQAMGVRISRFEVVCHDLPPQSPVRGLLGLNFLKHLNLHLDFPRRRLTVSH
jgi:predicted aspartyl protease